MMGILIFSYLIERDLETTDLLYTLLFESSGYQLDTCVSKFKKPEECPVCYQTEESMSTLNVLQPCQHWCCEDCINRFEKNQCPLCRTSLNTLLSDSFHTEEEKKECSEYDELIKIKYFRMYKHPVTNKSIQCIYVQNVRKSIRTFDLSICQVFYGGSELYANNSEKTQSMIGYCNHPSKLTEKQKKRVEKYRKRGFSIYSNYACHSIEDIYETLPIEKDAITYVLYPFLKQKKEKPYMC